MKETAKEEEMPMSPGPNSSVPEIFSSKKIFFLNSCSGSRRSEIPQIESDYSRRDEVSRRLFHHNSDLCDCDCASDGCGGCIRRNKQCFFKFFVLGLSIALILLLFGSLSYNLTRNKAADESFDFEKTQWVSHNHEYPVSEIENSGANNTTLAKVEPVLDLPYPLYEHSDDYDSDEELRRLQYHLDFNPDRGHDQIEPISAVPLSDQYINPQSEVLIIYDGREPSRVKRSISSRSKTKERGKYEELGKPKRDTESESYEFLFEKLNGVEEGMDKFWESYFKKGKTVFEPFSLTTPSHSTPMKSEEYSEEEEIEDELKNMFLSQPVVENFNPVTPQIVNLNIDHAVDTIKTTTLVENSFSEQIPIENTEETQTDVQTTEGFIPESATTEEDPFDSMKSTTDKNAMESEISDEAFTTEAIFKEEVSTENNEYSIEEDLRMDSIDGKNFRTWHLLPFPLPFSGLYGSRPEDRITAESAPLDTVKGISLADAKKIKKEKRKHLLLNSRVVGGSSDVRLPTGPDVSKPFVNAFETLKTNQQLSFTPSAASQFILPYQMCLFGGPFFGPRPSGHGPQPRTFSFGVPPLLPSIYDKTQQSAKGPSQVPTQQNFLSFSINNYPNAPSRQSYQPSAGSFFNFPGQQPFSQFPGPNKQPIFCTYLQPPLFQFPTVPGTADFSHAKCVDCQGESQKDMHFAKEIAFSSGRDTLCSDDKVSCLDGSSCIHVGYWCDNQVHCKDASDEAFCSCRERISKERLCDGYVDCPHGEDETACFDCPKSAFSCGSFVSPDSCIPLSKRCDGVRDCSTGADESDCSALFFNVRQNNSYHVSQVTGYLHRNWKGDWFPVCVEISESMWAKEACLGELGFMPSNVEMRFAPVSPLYKGPFIVRGRKGKVALQDHCKGHVSTFVTCPPMNCGTRIQFYNIKNSYLEEVREKDTIVKRSSSLDKNKGKLEDENSRLRREETGRVVGGRESEPKAWPWAIAVYKNGAFHCGGVILDENWVLTAAHCMEQYWKHYYEIRGGMLRRFSYSAMEQARTVSHVIIHENYDLTIMSNDLALLRLKEPFHFNRWVRPACLPVLQDGISKFSSGPAPGTRCTAVGWGALKERGIDPDQLREVEIPIMSRCKHKEDLVGEEICAGKLEGGKDTCQGDSGGPLLCRDSSSPASWYVAGIVSHGEGCARPGEPGAYTRISLFVDWITANTNDFQLPSVKPLQSCPGFRCQSASKLCIPSKWVCNGITDCLEAEDEKNCNDSSIFNRKYSSEEKYFGKGHAKDKNFEGVFKILGGQPPNRADNWQGQQKIETNIGLENEELLRRTTASSSTSGSFIMKTSEGTFSFESAERHFTEDLKKVELARGMISPTLRTESSPMKTASAINRGSIKKHPTVNLKSIEPTKETSTSGSFAVRAIQGVSSRESIEKSPTEGLKNEENQKETTVPSLISTSFTMRTTGDVIGPESAERRSTEDLKRETTMHSLTTETFTGKTTEGVLNYQTVERLSSEGLKRVGLVTETLKSSKEPLVGTTGGIFSSEIVESRPVVGVNVKLVTETSASSTTILSPSKNFPGRTTEGVFHPEIVERHPTESLKNVELVTETSMSSTEPLAGATEGIISPEIVESRPIVGVNVELVTETSTSPTELLSITESFPTRTTEGFLSSESIERYPTESYQEITITDKVTEGFEKKFREKDGRGKTNKDTWTNKEEKVSTTTEELFLQAEENERNYYEGITKDREDGNIESESFERKYTENIETDTEENANNESDWVNEKKKKVQIITEEVLPETEEQDTQLYAEVNDSTEDENVETESFGKEYTTQNLGRKTNEEKNWDDEVTVEVTEQTGEQERKLETYDMIDNEKTEENISDKYLKNTESFEINYIESGRENTNKESTLGDDENGKLFEDVEIGTQGITEEEMGNEKAEEDDNRSESESNSDIITKTSTEKSWSEVAVFDNEDITTEELLEETERNEERRLTTEGFVTGTVEQENNFYEYVGIEDEKTEEDDIENRKQITEAEDAVMEEEKAYTQESFLTVSTTSFESRKDMTEASAKDIEMLTLSTKAHETEPSEAEIPTTATQIYSIRTRETEINFEKYSTSSSTLQSSDIALDYRLSSNPDYFQCRQIVQSILPTYRCDGIKDCEDGTDEEDCTCIQVLRNLNPGYLCDGRKHCADGSDENNCTKCQENEFYCEKSKECVPLESHCNGTLDCTFGEDEAKCISLGESPLRFQTEGLMMINKNGNWKVLCQEELTPYSAADAIKVCSTLGTVGYERYENRSLGSNCTGFHVTCAKSLLTSVKRYKVKNGSYLWPWNGVVYSDGRIICSGVLLRPRWLLTSSQCLHNISLSKNYLIVKFEDETAIRVDGVHFIPESDAVLLHLSKEINQTESVRPLGIPYVFESDPKKDVCIAVGDRTVFLKILKRCRRNFRCYKKITSTRSGCRSKPWMGVIVCQSRFGWYPSSAFSEKLGHCGFEGVNFTGLQENVRYALDKTVDVYPEPVCDGFRCPQGLCISPGKICDGKPDCFGKEDESFDACVLRNNNKECKVTELKCRNGRCIPKVLFGDGIKDCEDGSDEPSNVTCVEYLRLTAPEKICNGKRNCYDKTDENYKICSCDDFKYQCKLSGYCIPKDLVCDGEKDCPGGEDEEQCMGRKIVRNSTKAHLEVLQKSYGIWHTMCPSHMSKERSDAFCKDLGFKEALFTYSRNQTVILPKTDPFSWVKLNHRTSIGLRENRPFVRLVTLRKTCDSVKCA